MSAAEDALLAGDVDQALRLLTEQVKKDPSKAEYRIFLFQVLAVLGQWERALTQLSVLGEMSSKTVPMAQTYREAIRCEVFRAEVFEGKRTPLLLGQPPDWIAPLLESLRMLAGGNVAAAESLREKALEGAPATPGKLAGEDGLAFGWIADADSRIGPVLEAIVNGRYYWVPFERLSRVKIERPTDLRDFVWAPAQLVFANGGETVALVPTRYPGSEKAEGPLRLSRRTEWAQLGPATYVGTGQRMLATDQQELPILDLDLTLQPASDGGNG